jgi:hypothetical protein
MVIKIVDNTMDIFNLDNPSGKSSSEDSNESVSVYKT